MRQADGAQLQGDQLWRHRQSRRADAQFERFARTGESRRAVLPVQSVLASS